MEKVFQEYNEAKKGKKYITFKSYYLSRSTKQDKYYKTGKIIESGHLDESYLTKPIDGVEATLEDLFMKHYKNDRVKLNGKSPT